MKRNILFPLVIIICLLSCKKEGEDRSSARLSVTHLVIDAPALDLSQDGSNINDQPLSFGSNILSNGSIYNAVKSGLGLLRLSNGSSTYLEKNVLLEKDSSYTMIFYDSVRNSTINAMLIRDIMDMDSTRAKLRFFHLIPGEDTLRALIANDTSALPLPETYLGNKFSAEGSYPFRISLKPGLYSVDLLKGSSSIYRNARVNLQGGKFYTFIASGAKGGTDVYKESITILQHN